MTSADERRFDAVLFDLGNTLIYFDGEWPEVIRQGDTQLLAVLQAAGLRLDTQAFTTEFETRLDAYYSQRNTEFIEYTTAYILRGLLADMGYPEVSETTLQRALKAMYAISQAHWIPESDAQPTLQFLRQQGYHLGLISNAGDDRDVQILVDKAGVRLYFDVILTSAAEGIRKPNPHLFHKALSTWGTPPGRAAMVGDTLGADILGARNAGLFSIWITRRADSPGNQAHQDTIQPDASIDTLAELPELLSSL